MTRIPTQTQTAAAATEKTVVFTEMSESILAGAFVRILTVEIKQVHSGPFLLSNMEWLQIVFQWIHWQFKFC